MSTWHRSGPLVWFGRMARRAEPLSSIRRIWVQPCAIVKCYFQWFHGVINVCCAQTTISVNFALWHEMWFWLSIFFFYFFYWFMIFILINMYFLNCYSLISMQQSYINYFCITILYYFNTKLHPYKLYTQHIIRICAAGRRTALWNRVLVHWTCLLLSFFQRLSHSCFSSLVA